MRIYISIPITGQDQCTQRRKARKWQRYFESKGHIVSNPFDIADRLEKFHKDTNRKAPVWGEYMIVDIAELITNDAIFFCNGWSDSRGCIDEAETATQDYSLKVLFERTYDTD